MLILWAPVLIPNQPSWVMGCFWMEGNEDEEVAWILLVFYSFILNKSCYSFFPFFFYLFLFFIFYGYKNFNWKLKKKILQKLWNSKDLLKKNKENTKTSTSFTKKNL